MLRGQEAGAGGPGIINVYAEEGASTDDADIKHNDSSEDADFALDLLESIVNYRFADRLLLLEAITHSSVKAERGPYVRTNIRLEVLGDSILGYVITDMIFRKHPTAKKGKITELRKAYVSNQALNNITLAKGARGHSLYDLIIKGDSINNNSNKAATMVADTVESIIAAIYLDSGLEEATEFIMNKIVADIDHSMSGVLE